MYIYNIFIFNSSNYFISSSFFSGCSFKLTIITLLWIQLELLHHVFQRTTLGGIHKLNRLSHITNTPLIVYTTQHYSCPVIVTRLLVTPKYIDTQAWCHTGDVERSTFTDMQQRFVGEVRGFRTEGYMRGHKKSSKQWSKAETESKRKRDAEDKGWPTDGQWKEKTDRWRRTDEKQKGGDKLCWHTKI